MSTSGGSSGGGAAYPDYTGNGSPEGVKTAAVGKSYGDTTNGALYFKATGAGNTGWVGAGGTSVANPPNVAGTFANVHGLGGPTLLAGTGHLAATITDMLAVAGTANGITYQTTGVDGQQFINFELGSTGQFLWNYDTDGSTEIPGTIATVPPPSHTVDVALGALTLGTAFQNTLAYDAEVLITIVVTAATAATISAGIGPTTTPTQDAVIPSFSTAALEIINLRFRIPAGQYLLLSTGGTITVSSTTTWCQAG